MASAVSGLTKQEAPSAAVADLAGRSAVLVDRILERHPVRRLAIAGGDTSSRIVGALGFWGLAYESQLDNGVAVSTRIRPITLRCRPIRLARLLLSDRVRCASSMIRRSQES